MAYDSCVMKDTWYAKGRKEEISSWSREISSVEEEKKKEKKERKEEKKGKKEKSKKRRKEGGGFFLSSPTFRQSEFVGLRSKVRLRNVGCAQRGRDLSYFGLFSNLRAVWWCFCLKGLFGQILE